jgi:hypothetical protein
VVAGGFRVAGWTVTPTRQFPSQFFYWVFDGETTTSTRLQLTYQVVAGKNTMPTIHFPSWLAYQADAGWTTTSTN